MITEFYTQAELKGLIEYLLRGECVVSRNIIAQFTPDLGLISYLYSHRSRYGADRGIRLIPEIDLPAHASPSMQQLDVAWCSDTALPGHNKCSTSFGTPCPFKAQLYVNTPAPWNILFILNDPRCIPIFVKCDAIPFEQV